MDSHNTFDQVTPLINTENPESKSTEHETFVLDTNVLLHDPDAISRFTDATVALPLCVLEELDKMKHYSDELGKNARQAIRFIDSLKDKGDYHKGIKLKDNLTFQIMLDVRQGEKRNFPLDRTKNKVLLSVHQLEEKGHKVTLISKDVLMRVKAQAMGIHSTDYARTSEPFRKLYRGLRKIHVPKSKVDQFFSEGILAMPEEKFHPNEYCILISEENSSAVCKYNAKMRRLEPLLNLSRDIWGINPLNVEQRCAMDLLLRDDIKLVTLIGQAGSGKTLMTVACALKKVFDESVYKRIMVSRPIMPLGKDIGYLPGTKEEKLIHWMQPIYDNLRLICESTSGGGEEMGRETQKWILDSNKIEMEAVTYIRGRSLANMFIIIDEAQNLTPHEVKTIISRVGHNTKIILTGDPSQIDNPYLDEDSNALTYIVNRFKNYPIFGQMQLSKTERSELSALAAEIL
ncbi:MAG: PhoH family protein [Simkaniaceae bacterium]|nr:PhoH family protein [Simkaniaceae bacterium]